MSSLIKCIFGPRLFRIHGNRAGTEGRMYTPNMMESGSDTVIKWVKFCYSLSYYTSPVLLGFLYRRNYFTLEGGGSLVRFLSNITSIFLLSWFLRGLGRYRNEDYLQFLHVLTTAQHNPTEENRRRLACYDFEFGAWPVDFRYDQVEESKGKREPANTRSHKPSRLTAMPCDILSYILAHTIGLGMVYPGSTAMIRTLIAPALLDGRSKLYEEHQSKRAKLLTRDGNQIDTMYVNKRNKTDKGKYLVICSEGNSGYYEVGCMVTPLEGGYSVLGWNHPGFGGSTGRPYPSQEQNAIDTVLQYAIHELKHDIGDIYLFAWSIGGYSASWAASRYPDLRGVILDATFDDLVPLAVARMPRSWRGLVTMTVRRYINLDIADQLCQYHGPVLLIRRYRDEMICTEDAYSAASNRGNDLLVKLLQYRYPEIVTEGSMPLLRRWLAGGNVTRDMIIGELDLDLSVCARAFNEVEEVFPSKFGQGLDDITRSKYTIFLALRYLSEYDSTHCTPLPVRFFNPPWRHNDDVITGVTSSVDEEASAEESEDSQAA